MTDSIIRLPQVKNLTGLSRSSIYAAVKRGDFPSPVSLGARAVGWMSSEINSWLTSRARASSTRTLQN